MGALVGAVVVLAVRAPGEHRHQEEVEHPAHAEDAEGAEPDVNVDVETGPQEDPEVNVDVQTGDQQAA